jgi:hypothetical protein
MDTYKNYEEKGDRLVTECLDPNIDSEKNEASCTKYEIKGEKEAYIIDIKYKSINDVQKLPDIKIKHVLEFVANVGFQCKGYLSSDLKYNELEKVLLTLLCKNFEETGALMIIIFGHGNDTGVVSSDGQTYDYKKIAHQIGLNITMNEKPKWLIFACCHGSMAVEGPNNKPKVKFWHPEEIHPQQDILISYAAPLGYVAYAEDKCGDDFLGYLLLTLQKIKNKKEIEVMEFLTMVNFSISKGCTKKCNKGIAEHSTRLIKQFMLSLKFNLEACPSTNNTLTLINRSELKSGLKKYSNLIPEDDSPVPDKITYFIKLYTEVLETLEKLNKNDSNFNTQQTYEAGENSYSLVSMVNSPCSAIDKTLNKQ